MIHRSIPSLILVIFAILGGSILCSTIGARQGPPPPGPPPKPAESQQKPPATQTQDEGEIKLGTDLVTLNLSITDAQGHRITDLKKSEIKLLDDNVPQELSFFNTTEEPFHVVLLIDMSGSTQTQVNLIKQSAREFLDQLRPGDEVAIVSFAEAPTLEADFTSSRPKLEKAIKQLAIPPPAHAGTSFYDALRIMVAHVLKSVEGRKAFVALTDGVDSTSVADYREIRGQVTQSGATGYFIQIDSEEYTLGLIMKSKVEDGAVRISKQQLQRYLAVTPHIGDPSRYDDGYKLSPLERREVNEKLYDIARDELKELADRTGGHVYPVDRIEQAPDALKEIADEIRRQYSVGYYPRPGHHDGKWHELKVEVKRSGFTVHTRPGYTAPGG